MKKLSMFVLSGAAAAGVLFAGAGMASADPTPTTPPATSTGSADGLAKFLQTLLSGSAGGGGTTTPAPAAS